MYKDVDVEEAIPGIKFWRNKNNKFHVLMLHHSADPDKSDRTEKGREWIEKEKTGTPKAVWDKEYQIDFSTKSGDLVFGPKYCDFDPKVHLINSFELGDVELVMSLDFGQRNPNAALIFAITMDGTIYLIDEYYKPAIPSVASREMFSKFGYLMPGYEDSLTIRQKKILANNTFQYKVIDPSTGAKNRTKIIEGEEIPYSVIEDFADNGWEFDRGNNDWEAGITRLREYFRIDGNRKSHFYIFADKCPMYTWELQHYRYQEHTDRTKRQKNESEKPVKKDDHGIDSSRYFIMSRPNRPEEAPKKLTKIQKDINNLLKPKVYNDFDVT